MCVVELSLGFPLNLGTFDGRNLMGVGVGTIMLEFMSTLGTIFLLMMSSIICIFFLV